MGVLTNTHQHGRYKTVRFNSSSFCRTEVSMLEQAISSFENKFSIVFKGLPCDHWSLLARKY